MADVLQCLAITPSADSAWACWRVSIRLSSTQPFSTASLCCSLKHTPAVMRPYCTITVAPCYIIVYQSNCPACSPSQQHRLLQSVLTIIITTTTTTTTLHPLSGLFSRTVWVSWYQKGKTSLDLNEARDDGVLGCSGISWTMPSVLWRCWLGGRKGIRPVKTEWWGAGVVICLERGADLHMAQLMPLSLTVSCSSKIQIGFAFLVPVHPDRPGQRAVKWMCGIIWTICRQSAPRCRPTPHHSIFRGRMLFLMPNQQCGSTEGMLSCLNHKVVMIWITWYCTCLLWTRLAHMSIGTGTLLVLYCSASETRELLPVLITDSRVTWTVSRFLQSILAILPLPAAGGPISIICGTAR